MLTETKVSCFLCVAKTLSYTKAACLLHMTPQAVSKYIIDMENQFGFQLFYRDNKHVELTKSGQQCFELFSKYMDDYNRFITENRNILSQQVQKLRVGYLQFDFNQAIVNAFQETQVLYPELTISMESNSAEILLDHLENNLLDLILISDNFIVKQPHQHCVKLKAFSVYLMVSAAHPLMKAGASISDFVNAPIIIDRLGQEPEAETLVRANLVASRIGMKPSKIIIVPNRETVYTSVEMGLGIALGGMSQHNSIIRGAICKLPTDYNLNMMCVWYDRDDKQRNKQIKTYTDFLLQEYQKL